MSRVIAAIALVAIATIAARSGLAHYLPYKEAVVQTGKLTIGVASTGKPFAYRSETGVVGLDVDIAAEMARTMNLELEIVPLPRARLGAALEAGQVDAVNNGGSENVIGAGAEIIPYLRTGDHLVVLTSNPFRIHTVEDLAGQVASATSGTPGELFAREINARLAVAGRPPMEVHSFLQDRFTKFPVMMGHAAAFFAPTETAVGLMLDPDSKVKLVEGLFRPSGTRAFAVKKGNDIMRDSLDHALARLASSGRYERLMDAYRLPRELSIFE
jgi:polar amino acid transport system substrate-binding protein